MSTIRLVVTKPFPPGAPESLKAALGPTHRGRPARRAEPARHRAGRRLDAGQGVAVVRGERRAPRVADLGHPQPRGRLPRADRAGADAVTSQQGTFTPAPGAAPLPRMVLAQARMESRLMLRNGEQLLLAVVIPVIVLVGMVRGADRLGLDYDHPVVDVVTPGVLALAVMSTAFTSLAIATGFERRYGVLKRLGASPLPRSGLLLGKVGALLLVEVLQLVVLVAWSACCSAGTRVMSASAWSVPARGAARHGGVRLARPADGRRAARRGHAGRRQPGLPAAAGRRRGRAPRVGVRRLRRGRRSGCPPARSARRCATRSWTAPSPGGTSASSLGWAVVGTVADRADVLVGVSPRIAGSGRSRWATLVANIVLVVTGGAVRLTGSGLGCPTWPRCTDESFRPHGELVAARGDRVRQPDADVRAGRRRDRDVRRRLAHRPPRPARDGADRSRSASRPRRSSAASRCSPT